VSPRWSARRSSASTSHESWGSPSPSTARQRRQQERTRLVMLPNGDGLAWQPRAGELGVGLCHAEVLGRAPAWRRGLVDRCALQERASQRAGVGVVAVQMAHQPGHGRSHTLGGNRFRYLATLGGAPERGERRVHIAQGVDHDALTLAFDFDSRPAQPPHSHHVLLRYRTIVRGREAGRARLRRPCAARFGPTIRMRYSDELVIQMMA
jgi:hypothetical protein